MNGRNIVGLLATGFLAGLTASQAAAQVSNYDDLAEGFYGPTFTYNGVTYRDVNGVPGSFPSGETFEADYPGENFIIENSTFLFNDHPDWGTSPNTLTFGNAFVPGDNLSVGGFSRASMDFDAPVSSIAMNMIFYENGPWGGIVFHLDGLRNGSVVASATYTLANGGGRDNLTKTVLNISDDAGFDSANIYATWADGYSAPRLMIDNLTLTPATVPCPADFNADGFVNPDDLSDFITCFFLEVQFPGTCPDADFNTDIFTNPDDLSDYITAFFTAAC
jgi:hypothetical protein